MRSDFRRLCGPPPEPEVVVSVRRPALFASDGFSLRHSPATQLERRQHLSAASHGRNERHSRPSFYVCVLRVHHLPLCSGIGGSRRFACLGAAPAHILWPVAKLRFAVAVRPLCSRPHAITRWRQYSSLLWRPRADPILFLVVCFISFSTAIQLLSPRKTIGLMRCSERLRIGSVVGPSCGNGII